MKIIIIHSFNLAKVIGIDGFGYRREFEQFCPLLLRRQEPKEISALGKCFRRYGYAWNWLSHYDDDATISHNNENLSACEQDLHLRDIERSHEREARAKERQKWGAGKESESFSFTPPLRTSPLTRAFPCHSKWWGYSQSIIFLGNRARSLFGEPLNVRNSEENF